MKFLKCLTILGFCTIIMLPVIDFNFEENAVSEIDNRMLASNPFSTEGLKNGGFTQNIENYVSDRIGYRDFMIREYTILNDKIFDEMVHPIYTYGKEGYVFGAGIETTVEYNDFHVTYANMVKEIQTYCQERNIPFLFVFNPAKPAIYSDYIADGINYDRSWVDEFFIELDQLGVNYLDNTITLEECKKDGKTVFNPKYDANHWNSLGAFYGTQKILENMKKDIPTVHVNELSEFNISEEHKETLLVSQFPIDEMVPVLSSKIEIIDKTQEYGSINLNPNYRTFGYKVNVNRKNKKTPKTLVFQGSYMNGYGYLYMENALEEYIYVHDYQNVINFPYYYNIFKPDYVIFEVGEYTLSNTYFDYEKMKSIDYNPTLEKVQKNVKEVVDITIPKEQVTIKTENAITTIQWESDEEIEAEYIWLLLGNRKEYDMIKSETGYQVSIETEEYKKDKEEIIFLVLKNKKMYRYTVK